jgi:hypothetical protein
MDAGADASVDGGDATDADAGDAADADDPDASGMVDADVEPDASEEETDGSVALDSGVDGSVDSGMDAGDGGPIMLTGVGPVIPDPAVDFAGSPGHVTDDDIDDAVFTATLTLPISKLVLVNTEANGDSHYISAWGGYYARWTTSNPIPDDVPGPVGDTEYNIYTRLVGSTDPFPIPVLGLEESIDLEMYVSFDPDPARTIYYRLYVFGADDELTQIVDFEEEP